MILFFSLLVFCMSTIVNDGALFNARIIVRNVFFSSFT
jgi:hypothetical protein